MIADLRSFILAGPGVADLIGDRIYPNVLPQGATYPAASMRMVSPGIDYLLTGESGWHQARVQLNVVATSSTQALQVASEIRARVSGHRGATGATAFDGIFVEGMSHTFDTEKSGERRPGVVIELRVHHGSI